MLFIGYYGLEYEMKRRYHIAREFWKVAEVEQRRPQGSDERCVGLNGSVQVQVIFA